MVRNVRQIVRCGIQIYPTVHSLSGRRVKDRSRPFAKGRNPPGNGEENLPSPNGLRFSLTSARVCPSDCCGKIPWSGSRWNSRSVRSICIRTGSSRHLRKVRAFSSGCFGMIPLSGSRWNSRSARSTCRSTFAFPRPRRERVCPSDCCGKIPRSGSIRNSKNARSTCNKTSCLLLLPGQRSLGSEVHPNEFASRHAKTIAPWPPDAQSPLGRSFGGLSFSGMPSRKLLRRSPGQSSRQRAPPHGARAHRRGRTRRPRPPCPSKTS